MSTTCILVLLAYYKCFNLFEQQNKTFKTLVINNTLIRYIHQQKVKIQVDYGES